MDGLTALVGGSIILLVVIAIVSLAFLIFTIWLFFSIIKLIRYAKWKIDNDYSYQHRKK